MVPISFAVPATANAGAASAELVAANPARRYLRLTNVSDEAVALGFGQDAVANRGVVLLPAVGGVPQAAGIFEFPTPGGVHYTGAVNAISAGGADKAVAIQEG